MSSDLYAAPQHVGFTHAAWRASEPILAPLGGDLCRILHPNFREFPFRNCLKSLDGRKTKALEAYETGAKGLISLRYAGDFCARDTTERLFRQFLHALR